MLSSVWNKGYRELMFRRPTKLEIEAIAIGAAMLLPLTLSTLRNLFG